MPPDDPLGRNGPTLDQFHRRRPAPSAAGSMDQQPCPYGKKCTYGNKCKYFHAERGNQPQKSVTDKLKEHSSQKINEVRARVNSRETSPGKHKCVETWESLHGAHFLFLVAGDPLTRTRSMQPLQRADSSNLFAQEKQALCRTRSTVPRLNVPPPPPPGTSVLPPPPPPPTSQPQAPGTPERQQQPYWLPHPPPPPPPTSSSDDKKPASLWSGQFNLGQLGTPASSLPDTSMPPPPPRSPWSHDPIVTSASTGSTASSVGGGADDTTNQHRKISRQLTINPYDPRIHHQGIPFPPPTDIPPPNMQRHLVQQQQQQQQQQQPQHSFGDHHAVTRNASAPEQLSSSSSRFAVAPPIPLCSTVTAAPGASALGSAVRHQQQQQQLQQQQQQPSKQHRDSGDQPAAVGSHLSSASSSDLHSHLHRMNSTSDSQLHKTLSQPVQQQPAQQQQQQHQQQQSSLYALQQQPRMLASAVSPLIGSGDGVWGTSGSSSPAAGGVVGAAALSEGADAIGGGSGSGSGSGGGGGSGGKRSSAADLSEARSNMYYHLAALFPEEQVLAAMTVMPEETNVQKICAYILCLNQARGSERN